MHLYSPEVQKRCIELGLTTGEKIRRNALLFKIICVPGYIAYVLVFVYAVNGARGFFCGFLAVARYPLGYESYRSFSYRRRVGRAYEGLDDSGHRRSKALYYGKGQSA